MNFLKKVTPFSNLRLFIILTFEYFLGQHRQLLSAGLDLNKARKASKDSVVLSSLLFNDYKRIKYVDDMHIYDVPCRIYRHKSNREGAKPILLFFHSGGFALFDYKSPDFTCRRLCKMLDAVVISVEYRKSPEHKFGAAQEDAIKVFQWAHKDAETLGADANKIFVCGDSAGGYLSAYLAKYAAENPEYTLRGSIPIYPWLDLKMSYPSITERDESPICTKEELDWYVEHHISSPADLEHPDADLTRQDNFEKQCPALVLTCEMDTLADEGNAYAENLKKAGVPVMHREYKAVPHGFMYFPNIFNPRKKEHPFKYIETFIDCVLNDKELPNISN